MGEERKEDSGLLNVSPFRFVSPQFSEVKALTFNGANIEYTVYGGIPADVLSQLRRGKLIVESITPLITGDYIVKPFNDVAFTVRVEEAVSNYLGGGAANFSIALEHMGYGRCGFTAPTSGSPNSEKARSLEVELQRLRGEGRQLEWALYPGSGTAMTLNVLDKATGESRLFCVKPPFELTLKALAALKQAKPALLGAISVKQSDMALAAELFAHFPEARKVVVPHWDCLTIESFPRIAELIKQATLVMMNRQEAERLCKLLLSRAADNFQHVVSLVGGMGAKVTVITVDKDGAHMVIQGHDDPVYQRAVPAVTSDTCGGGDARAAAMIMALEQGFSPQEALAISAHVAAEVVSKRGPTTGIPDVAGWNRILKIHRE